MKHQHEQSASTLVTGEIVDQLLHLTPAARRSLEREGLPVLKLSARRRRYDLEAVQGWLRGRGREHNEQGFGTR